MWWKLLSLTLLCSPLGYRAWQEIESHSTDSRPQQDLLGREELTRKKSALQEFKESLEGRALDESLASVVFRVSSEPPRSNSKRPRSLEPLARALASHAEVIQDIRRFASVWMELENDPTRPADCRDADLKNWLEARRVLVKTRKDRETALAAELAGLTDKVRAAIRRRDSTTIKLAQEDVEGALTSLEKHRGECSGFSLLIAWTDRRLREWGGYRDLLAVAEDEALVLKSGTRDEVLRHVGRYARLLERSELATFVRAETIRFCEGYLPAWMEGENLVIYRGISVPRENVYIKWKKETPEARRYPNGEVPLSRTEYDEFKPPDLAHVEYYFRPANKGDDDSRVQIRPTPRNEATRHYNQTRKSLRWTPMSLETLVTNSPVRWPDLSMAPLPIQRAEYLLEAMRKYPALFSRGE
jgi:hypothetical protein